MKPGMKIPGRILICATLLSVAGMGCTKRSIEPRGEVIQKAGSSNTPGSCVSSMVNSLTLVVRNLHVRKTCQRHGETQQFEWSYVFRDDSFSGEAGSIERCIDGLAT